MDHLELPQPVALPDRRQGSAFGASQPCEPSTHGGALHRGLDEARAAPVCEVVDGVDPRRVFNNCSSTRITDAEPGARELQLLGDTDDWTYFVVPDEESAAELYRAIDAYSRGGADGEAAPLAGFFDRISQFEPYGPEDRTTGPLENARRMGSGHSRFNIVIRPSPDQGKQRAELMTFAVRSNDMATLYEAVTAGRSQLWFGLHAPKKALRHCLDLQLSKGYGFRLLRFLSDRLG